MKTGMNMRHALTLVCCLWLLSGCGRTARVSGPPLPNEEETDATPTVAGAESPGPPALDLAAATEEGEASWYGDPYHGRQAASGEVFDKNKLTAAHRTLPFDTWVRVENKTNGKTVDVRINDRGPFVAGRIIDLSEAAAREIDMVRAGVAPVRVRVLGGAGGTAPPPPSETKVDDGFYVVQLGAFSQEENAENLTRRLSSRYTGIYVEAPSQRSALYRVLIGRARFTDAQVVQNQLRAEEGIEALVIEVAD